MCDACYNSCNPRPSVSTSTKTLRRPLPPRAEHRRPGHRRQEQRRQLECAHVVQRLLHLGPGRAQELRSHTCWTSTRQRGAAACTRLRAGSGACVRLDMTRDGVWSLAAANPLTWPILERALCGSWACTWLARGNRVFCCGPHERGCRGCLLSPDVCPHSGEWTGVQLLPGPRCLVRVLGPVCTSGSWRQQSAHCAQSTSDWTYQQVGSNKCWIRSVW